MHRDTYSVEMRTVNGTLMYSFSFFIVPVLSADWLSHVQGRGKISDNCTPVTEYQTI